ncbi:hypothetical protein FRC02_003143 [Tulasnella sp. 418]|nr:hypothetical protein FRC02_003143 [Tulasnella sp. 418]
MGHKAGNIWVAIEQAEYFHNREITPSEDDDSFNTIIRRAFSQMHGQVKDVARPLVIQYYGFQSVASRSKRLVEDNRRLYQKMVERDAYIHSEYKDPNNLRGRWSYPILTALCRGAFFSKETSDGVVHRNLFSPISPQLIALLATVVYNCLEEYRSGRFKAIEFKSVSYSAIYNTHLTNLQAINAQGGDFLQFLGKEIFEDCIEGMEDDGDTDVEGRCTMMEEEILLALRDAEERKMARNMRQDVDE